MPVEQDFRLFSQAVLNAGSILSKDGNIWTRSPKGLRSSLIYSWNVLTCQCNRDFFSSHLVKLENRKVHSDSRDSFWKNSF